MDKELKVAVKHWVKRMKANPHTFALLDTPEKYNEKMSATKMLKKDMPAYSEAHQQFFSTKKGQKLIAQTKKGEEYIAKQKEKYGDKPLIEILNEKRWEEERAKLQAQPTKDPNKTKAVLELLRRKKGFICPKCYHFFNSKCKSCNSEIYLYSTSNTETSPDNILNVTVSGGNVVNAWTSGGTSTTYNEEYLRCDCWTHPIISCPQCKADCKKRNYKSEHEKTDKAVAEKYIKDNNLEDVKSYEIHIQMIKDNNNL